LAVQEDIFSLENSKLQYKMETCTAEISNSSARKLRRTGVNLLAGRAVTRTMHPLTAKELGEDFSFEHALLIRKLTSGIY
jgi:hypothetical protein